MSLCGTDFLETLLQDMPLSSIPVRLGGSFASYNEEFHFDLALGGPLHYLGAPDGFQTRRNSVEIVEEGEGGLKSEEEEKSHLGDSGEEVQWGHSNSSLLQTSSSIPSPAKVRTDNALTTTHTESSLASAARPAATLPPAISPSPSPARQQQVDSEGLFSEVAAVFREFPVLSTATAVAAVLVALVHPAILLVLVVPLLFWAMLSALTFLVTRSPPITSSLSASTLATKESKR